MLHEYSNGGLNESSTHSLLDMSVESINATISEPEGDTGSHWRGSLAQAEREEDNIGEAMSLLVTGRSISKDFGKVLLTSMDAFRGLSAISDKQRASWDLAKKTWSPEPKINKTKKPANEHDTQSKGTKLKRLLKKVTKQTRASRKTKLRKKTRRRSGKMRKTRVHTKTRVGRKKSLKRKSRASKKLKTTRRSKRKTSRKTKKRVSKWELFKPKVGIWKSEKSTCPACRGRKRPHTYVKDCGRIWRLNLNDGRRNK